MAFSRLSLACSCLAFAIAPFGGLAQGPSSGSVSGFFANAPAIQPGAAQSSPPISVEMRGDIYMARKMYREAIDMYREGSPMSAILANKIGIAFHQLQQFDLAKKNYERAIKLNPKYSEAINNLGTIFYAAGGYRRAIGLYKRAIRFSPPSASIDANLGSAYFARRNYKEAFDWYGQAMALDPDVFEHHSHYGTLMQERTVGERATFHLYLAKIYAKAGENERALLYLRKALEEGVKDRAKVPDMPEFASLRTDPAFQELIALNPKPL